MNSKRNYIFSDIQLVLPVQPSFLNLFNEKLKAKKNLANSCIRNTDTR